MNPQLNHQLSSQATAEWFPGVSTGSFMPLSSYFWLYLHYAAFTGFAQSKTPWVFVCLIKKSLLQMPFDCILVCPIQSSNDLIPAVIQSSHWCLPPLYKQPVAATPPPKFTPKHLLYGRQDPASTASWRWLSMLMLQIWMRTAVVYAEGHRVKRGREQHHLQTNTDKVPRRADNNGGINNSI